MPVEGEDLNAEGALVMRDLDPAAVGAAAEAEALIFRAWSSRETSRSGCSSPIASSRPTAISRRTPTEMSAALTEDRDRVLADPQTVSGED